MKKISPEFQKQIKAFLLGFVILIGVSVVSAWTAPPSGGVASNSFYPINVSLAPQAKGKTSPTAGTLLDINGLLAANSLFVSGDTYISNSLILGKYSSSTAPASRHICFGQDGKFVLCDSSENIYSTAGNYTYTVPSGITKITVEMWGGGGAGYACNYGGCQYGASTGGGDTKVVHSSNSSKLNLIAYGGKRGKENYNDQVTSGGSGGSYSVSGSTVVSGTTTNYAGSNGGDGTPSQFQKYLCKVSSGTYQNYELWIGGDGGDGGTGGGTGGGAGGTGAPITNTDGSGNTLTTSSCGNSTTTSNIANNLATNGAYFGLKYPSTNGADATGVGAGGGGTGGASGKSAFGHHSDGPSGNVYNTSTKVNGLCNDDNGSGTYDKPYCNSIFYATGGGGAGGYIKTDVNVTAGDTYNITVGAGGNSCSTYSFCFGTWWSYINNYHTTYTGVNAGSGHDGQVKVSYQ